MGSESDFGTSKYEYFAEGVTQPSRKEALSMSVTSTENLLALGATPLVKLEDDAQLDALWRIGWGTVPEPRPIRTSNLTPLNRLHQACQRAFGSTDPCTFIMAVADGKMRAFSRQLPLLTPLYPSFLSHSEHAFCRQRLYLDPHPPRWEVAHVHNRHCFHSPEGR
jgi:hypothetical protein